jgi:hypothetical protein
MKTKIRFFFSVLITLSVSIRTYAQTLDVTLSADPGKTVLLPTLPDGSTWNIGIENGAFAIRMRPTEWEGVNKTWWITPCESPTAD